MYNIIVIGAGAVRLTAARILSKAGKSVLFSKQGNRIGRRVFTVHEKTPCEEIYLFRDFAIPIGPL